jgi:hypothetical protein
MKRSEFLSIIPALGALPFMSKEVIREKDRIIIPEPKQIEIVQEMPAYIDSDKQFEFLLVCDGQVVGSANPYEIGISDGVVNDMSCSMYSSIRMAPTLEVRATFNHEKVVKAFMNFRRK